MVAVVAAALAEGRYRGPESWVAEWMLGAPLPQPTVGAPVVDDAGLLTSNSIRTDGNLVVLRGPCLVGLRAITPLVLSTDVIVVVRESWRSTSSREVAETTGAQSVLEIPFSERVAQLADAGLLGPRLNCLEEFDELNEWLSIIPVGRQISA